MDTPILPETDGTNDGAARTQRSRALRPEVLRLATAVVVLAGAVVGLVGRLEVQGAGNAPVPAVRSVPTPPQVYYGDPVSPLALQPGTRADDPARDVCTDEVRPSPTGGHWRCVAWAGLRKIDRARYAAAAAGPCTHRTIALGETRWRCVSTAAAIEPVRRPTPGGPPFYGDKLDGNDVCIAEARPAGGSWGCTLWRLFPAGYSYVEPLQPAVPCLYRTADESTGAWSCRT